MNSKNQEISGYIDYAHRLKVESTACYFQGTRKMLPRVSDLSFYNWETKQWSTNNTANWQVIAECEQGMQFRNKRDRKSIVPGPSPKGDSFKRLELTSSEYIQVIFYDHQTGRKA